MRVALPRLLARLRRFRRSEDGSMAIFGLFLFVMMLIVAGMAVDVMRFETQRTRIQGTLDRAVLAAAELDQTRDCEEVVRSYFAAAGVLGHLNDPTCKETINSREVTASARFGVNTMFMDWVGVEELVAPAAGTAEESVSDIEIVLVLDVSGSMGEASGGSTKIALLREAAQEFVATVRQNDVDDHVSIAIVPFNAQVNLGPTIFNGMVGDGWSGSSDLHWDIVHRHGAANSFCLDLPDQAYAQAAIPHLSAPLNSLELPQAGHFDGVSSTTRYHTSYVAPQGLSTGQVFCRTETASIARLPSQDVTRMQGQLRALPASGNTSITMGMKWANFMLDPATRPFFTSMIGPGPDQIPETLRGRPYDYDRPNTRKIVVVMTDGEHVSSFFLNPGFRTELSPIFRFRTGTNSFHYSILRDRPDTAYDYFTPNLNSDPSTPANGIDDDQDGVVDDGIVGGWRVTPGDGTRDEDTDGPQYVDGVLVTACAPGVDDTPVGDEDDEDDEDEDEGSRSSTAAQPCDDDDLDDDGLDDGGDQDGDVDVDGERTVTQLHWHQVWHNTRVSWVAWNLYAKAVCGPTNTSTNNACRIAVHNTIMDTDPDDPTEVFLPQVDGPLPRFMSRTEVPDMNDTLQQSCTQAKNNGVEVYGIAFEAPPLGEAEIFDCASSQSHFYDAQGLDISEAFDSIAAQINALRLTD